MRDGTRSNYVDLHIHSTYSDGLSTIREIVEAASTKQMAAISLTDHDCIAGVAELTELAGRIGLEVVPGVEISSLHDNQDFHILGYFFDIHNDNLNRKLDEIRQIRIERARKIIDKLSAKGIVLRFERVQEFSKGFSLGRPHIAAALIAEEYVNNVAEAFDRYLNNNSEFYVPIQKLTPPEAIALIKEAGGIAILAHPHINKDDSILETLVQEGLDGLEVYHPRMPYQAVRQYRQFCHKYDLIETGGSDSHGAPHEHGIGSARAPYSAVEKMKHRQEKTTLLH
ncbi:MAG: hypothetical protein A2293_14425 [Elusimicrobia bacterium RIFOXYB2_FULL_49_7]|nr:MAG: hypothetical protein A2293_14425 [Elusimicrobia bacterium RIFOXYB2_FULL_49_7]